jgi:glycerol-3-phosphate acyltransferase PlsY
MALLAVMIFVSHRGNISRLVKGKEPGIGAR